MKRFFAIIISILLPVSILAQQHDVRKGKEVDSVYVTATGSVYHKDRSCSYLAKSKSIEKIGIDHVGSRHACSRCYPPKASQVTSSGTSSSGRTIYTGPRGGKYYIDSNGKKVYIKQ